MEGVLGLSISILSLIFFTALFTVPLRLIFKKWKDSTVGYVSAFVMGIVTVLLSGDINVYFPVGVLSVTVIMGSIIWGVLALIRKMRIRATNQPEKSQTTQDYIICPKCHLEQWSGYQVCQKCNTLLQAKK
jgi:hypothetical protein